MTTQGLSGSLASRKVRSSGFIGQMMEPLDLTFREAKLPDKPWAVMGTAGTRQNMISSIFLEPDDLENHIRKLEAKYIRASRLEARHETFETADAEVLLVGYGITARVLRSTVEMARREGLKAGLFRPSRCGRSRKKPCAPRPAKSARSWAWN